MPSSVASDDLADGAGDGDAANGDEIRCGEMQADAEHQQDDADFGQLRGKLRCRR